MINLGNIEIADLRLGSSQVKAVYVGSEQVWGGGSPTPPTPTGDWLCFTAEEANSTVRLDKVGSPNAISLETSTDGSTWADYSWTSSTGDTLTLANVGDKVYMRAKTENQTIGSSSSDYYKFIMTGEIAASGNIQTLLKADGSRTDAPDYCFESMFQDCRSLTTAPELPATTLANSCYSDMFKGCTSLTAAPAQPATTLRNNCYSNMFNGCTSLTAAPALPATTIADSCYSNMFFGCTSLTAAPALPATTLGNSCYSNMFKDCTSLTAAPALPATTLDINCYAGMFSGCTSLTAAPALPAAALRYGSYSSMFKGCTSLTAAPALPATTLANSCYSDMFKGCTSLTAAPYLPATTLAINCYSSMFKGCTSLSSVEVAFTTWKGGATNNWLNNVAASGTFKCPTALGTNETIDRGYSNCPAGWTVVNTDAA